MESVEQDIRGSPILSETVDIQKSEPISNDETPEVNGTSKRMLVKQNAVGKPEDGQMKAEDGQVKAEDGQVKAEDGQVKTEDGQVKTEDGQVKSEDSQVSEDGQVKTEDGQVKTEDGQVKSEDGQVKTEDGQMKAEDGQVKTEDGQMKTEDGQVKAEDGQVKTEDGQVKTEDGQVKTEDGQVKAEDSQVKTEDGQVKAEDSQVKTEDGQVKTEDGQVKTEDGQVKTEDGQVKTEDGQVKADVNQNNGVYSEGNAAMTKMDSVEQDVSVVHGVSKDYEIVTSEPISTHESETDSVANQNNDIYSEGNAAMIEMDSIEQDVSTVNGVCEAHELVTSEPISTDKGVSKAYEIITSNSEPISEPDSVVTDDRDSVEQNGIGKHEDGHEETELNQNNVDYSKDNNTVTVIDSFKQDASAPHEVREAWAILDSEPISLEATHALNGTGEKIHLDQNSGGKHEDEHDGTDLKQNNGGYSNGNSEVIDGNIPESGECGQEDTTDNVVMLRKPKRISFSSGSASTKDNIQRTISGNLDYSMYSPELSIDLLRSPSVQTLAGLKRCIDNSDFTWMQGFLDAGGLDVLLDCIATLGSRRVNELSDALTIMEAVACVKTVMNSKLGLEYLIQHIDDTRKLVKALDTNNVMVKKQVFELLSVVCIYSPEGHRLAVDALESFKISKSHRYRFSFVVNELRLGELSAYRSTLMAFINCLLVGSDDLQDRVSARNEFIGLKLLDVIAELRDKDDDLDLNLQCDVFEDEKLSDDETLAAQLPGTLDITSHQAVFSAIYQKLYNTPQSDIFLTLLQALLQLDTENNASDNQWGYLQGVTSKILYGVDIRPRKIRDFNKSNGHSTENHAQTDSDVNASTPLDTTDCPDGLFINNSYSASEGTVKALASGLGDQIKFADTSTIISDKSTHSSHTAPPAANTHQAPSDSSSQSHVLHTTNQTAPVPPPSPPPPPGMGGAPPPPPPMHGPGAPLVPSAQPQVQGIPTPIPSKKMRLFNWTKVPPQQLSSTENIWRDILTMRDLIPVKYQIIEQLFSQNKIERAQPENQVKKKEPTEVSLLDPKRSMNLNIFLKQFRMSHDQIVALVKSGNDKEIGAERLQGLLKILPQQDEIEMLNSYVGDAARLGNAEKFYLALIGLDCYKVRIEGMVLVDDFQTTLDHLCPDIQVMNKACCALMDNESLKAFLRLVLHTGNFLNAGGHAGNAVGFKISSLNKLMDTRANKPRYTLLHHLVSEAEQDQQNGLTFAEDLFPVLSAALRLTSDQLAAELNQLTTGVTRLSTQVDNADESIKNQFTPFIEKANTDLKKIHAELDEIKELSVKLAEHFCENLSSFKLEECLSTMKAFCEKVQHCRKENEQRRVQEEKAARRKKERESLAAKTKGAKPVELPEEDGCIIDKLLNDIRKGMKLRKATPD